MRIPKLTAFLLLMVSISCSKKNDGIHPVLGTVTESVYASGVVKAENQYTVFPTVNGILQKILVEPNQSVQTGQTLFKIESELATLNTENARLAYELSQEGNRYIQDKIAELEMKVVLAKQKLSFDEINYNRNKKLKDKEIISEADFEVTELAFKSSKLNYQTAKTQLEQLREQLKNDQNRSRVTLKINEKSERDFSVKSAISGQLFDVLVKEGTLVTTQTPLAIIGKENSFLLELEVDENDMVRVILGQKALLTLDSYKGQVFEAVVDKIYPNMDVRSRTFRIEAHFVKPPPKLYPNLTAEANIVIQTKKNVITIPKNYLLDGAYVLVNNDEKRKVKVGLSDYQKVEILEGLSATDLIYLPE